MKSWAINAVARVNPDNPNRVVKLFREGETLGGAFARTVPKGNDAALGKGRDVGMHLAVPNVTCSFPISSDIPEMSWQTDYPTSWLQNYPISFSYRLLNHSTADGAVAVGMGTVLPLIVAAFVANPYANPLADVSTCLHVNLVG